MVLLFFLPQKSRLTSIELYFSTANEIAGYERIQENNKTLDMKIWNRMKPWVVKFLFSEKIFREILVWFVALLNKLLFRIRNQVLLRDLKQPWEILVETFIFTPSKNFHFSPTYFSPIISPDKVFEQNGQNKILVTSKTLVTIVRLSFVW